VPDADDKCPDTPAGVKVNAEGCEPDSDHDGLVDRLDLCPQSAPGAEVDQFGCASDGRIILGGVTFEPGTADLTDASMKSLDKVVQLLKEHPEVRMEVAGYTDNIGDAARNLKVSEARARRVLNYLVSKGIDPARLVAKGYGEADPVADNATPAGRARNRRVELHKIPAATEEEAAAPALQ